MVLLEVVELTRSGEAERHALASFPFEARRFAYRVNLVPVHRLPAGKQQIPQSGDLRGRSLS